MKKILFFLVIILASIDSSKSLGDVSLCPTIEGKPSCVCRTSSGIIDLTPYGFQASKAPRFRDIKGNNSSRIYSYNPCYGYTIRGCTNANACLDDGINPLRSIADHGTEAMMINEDGSVCVTYSGIRDTLVVNLHCTKEKKPRLTAKTSDIINNRYVFDLYSCQVCAGGCGGGGKGGHPQQKQVPIGIIGVIIISILATVILTYFLVGALIRFFKLHATGSDVIPNKLFWCAFLGLIVDGCTFTFTPCMQLVCSRRRGYSDIPDKF